MSAGSARDDRFLRSRRDRCSQNGFQHSRLVLYDVRVPFQRCDGCGRLLGRKRAGSLHHDNRCRAASRRLRGAIQQLAPCFGELLDRLRTHAPAEATRYRVVLALPERRFLAYPNPRKEWVSWTGLRSERGYFRLYPFEPALVPIPARYGLLLFDQSGAELPTPLHLSDGAELVPIRPFPISDGEPW